MRIRSPKSSRTPRARQRPTTAQILRHGGRDALGAFRIDAWFSFALLQAGSSGAHSARYSANPELQAQEFSDTMGHDRQIPERRRRGTPYRRAYGTMLAVTVRSCVTDDDVTVEHFEFRGESG